jgi:hypothetical protein
MVAVGLQYLPSMSQTLNITLIGLKSRLGHQYSTFLVQTEEEIEFRPVEKVNFEDCCA